MLHIELMISVALVVDRASDVLKQVKGNFSETSLWQVEAMLVTNDCDESGLFV